MIEHSLKAVSAPSGTPQQWHDIDWRRVQRNVRAMQVRIAKACREGQWRRVKALQRMLTHSRTARYLAIRERVSIRCKAFTLRHRPSLQAFAIRTCIARTFR